MSLLNILTLPQAEKKLRLASTPLKPKQINDNQQQKFFDNLGKTMLKADGLGLAAPQVNQPIRVIAVNLNGQASIFVNPQIIKRSWRQNIMEEGCLSIPGTYGPVKRAKKIKIVYFDRYGHKHFNSYKDLIARVIQHEIDHLDGILFIDKLVK